MDIRMLKAAVAGGLFVGVAAAVPFIQLANVCCCLWGWLGAFLAVRLYAKWTSAACPAGRGLVIGVLTGLVAGLVWPLTFITVNVAQDDAMTKRFLQTARQMNFEPLLQKVAPERRENVKKRMEAFVAMKPRQALYHLAMLMAPFFAFVTTGLCALAGVLGALFLTGPGEQETDLPETDTPAPS